MEVYNRIIFPSMPQWHSDSDETGAVKVVMTPENATDPARCSQPFFFHSSASKTELEGFEEGEAALQKDTSEPLKLGHRTGHVADGL